MNKDKSLKESEKKLVFLICGNAEVGKKSFVNNILHKLNLQEAMNPEDKSFYIVYNFKLKRKIDDHTIPIPIEIRILNSNIFFILLLEIEKEKS
jgi:septin family protein